MNMFFKCLVIANLIVVVLLLIIGKSFAEEVPEGFEDVLEKKNVIVKLIVNDDRYILVAGEISNNTFRVLEGNEDLSVFLNKQYVKTEIANEIINSLDIGVESSLYCQGRRDTCSIDLKAVDDIQYIVMKEELKVRMIIPIKYLAKIMPEERYVNKNFGQSDAVIMNHQFRATSDDRDNLGVTYDNNFYAGFSGGYFSGDFVYDSDGYDEFYSDEFTYNYVVDEHKYRFGYHSGYANGAWNSTEFLNTSESAKVISFDIGTSSELEYKNKDIAERLYFSLPSSGRMEVIRDDGRILLTKNVSSGQNYISYSELPYGTYEVAISVKSGSEEIFNKSFSIYNNTEKFSMKPGDIDYLLSLGTFIDDGSYSSQDKNKINGGEFVNGKISTLLNEQSLVGLESVTTTEDYLIKFGGTYESSELKASLVYGMFESNATIFQSELSLYGVRFNTELYDSGDDSSLSEYFYGDNDYSRWSVNYNAMLWNGRLYTSYSASNSDFNLEDKGHQVNSQNLMVGYSFNSYFNSTIDTNINYMTSKSSGFDTDDETTLSVSINIPIGLRSYVGSTLNMSNSARDGNLRSVAGNSYEINDDFNISTEVGVNYETDETDYDLSGSSQYANENIDSSSYGYINSNGEFNLSGDLSLSTIYSKNEIYTTRKNSESYLIIHNDGRGAAEIKDNGVDFMSIAKITNNNKTDTRIFINNDLVVQPLNNYREYEVVLDEDSSDYHNLGASSATGTSLPGTIVDLGLNLRKVHSYISVFSDVEGRPIDSVSCKGDGCLSVHELADGVFKFRVSEGVPFELFSNNERCIIPDPSKFEEYNLGYNFCMPKFESLDGLQVVKTSNGRYLYYIGEFFDDSVIEQYENKINKDLITFVRKKIGDRVFLFASSKVEIANNMKSNIEELSTYALEELNNDPYVSR